MRVTEIEISGLELDRKAGLHRANVSMQVERDGQSAPIYLHFACAAEQPADCPGSLLNYELIKDALRQAHRMPGFRRGEEEILVVAEGAPGAAA